MIGFSEVWKLIPLLKGYSKIVLLFLVWEINETENIRVTMRQQSIVDATGVCTRAVTLALKELEEKGIIRIERDLQPFSYIFIESR